MLRIIVRTDDANMAANCNGGSVETTFKTFEISCPALEEYLKQTRGTYVHSQVIGAEFLP